MNLLSAMQQKLDARGRELSKAQRTIHRQREHIRQLRETVSHHAEMQLNAERPRHSALSEHRAAQTLLSSEAALVVAMQERIQSLERQLKLSQGKP